MAGGMDRWMDREICKKEKRINVNRILAAARSMSTLKFFQLCCTGEIFMIKWWIPLLGRTPRESKTYVHTKTCTWMFTWILLITAKEWKQPKCPWDDEWINRMWWICTILFGNKKEWNTDPCYSKEESSNMLSERSQPQMTKYHMIPFMGNVQSQQFWSSRRGAVVNASD